MSRTVVIVHRRACGFFPLTLSKYGLYKLFRVKLSKVLHFFTNAYESDGDLHLVGNAYNNPALCRAVQFGKGYPCNPDSLAKEVGL